jgi:AbrB family looped-hinge helix DNA binding protein
MVFDAWVHPNYASSMDTTVTLDNTGRIVIPKSVRDELHLDPGDRLVLESEGDKVTLRPVRATTPLQKEKGVWVYRTGRPPGSVSRSSQPGGSLLIVDADAGKGPGEW